MLAELKVWWRLPHHFLIALVLSGEKPPCGDEPRIELGPAFQQADAQNYLYVNSLVVLNFTTMFLGSTSAFLICLLLLEQTHLLAGQTSTDTTAGTTEEPTTLTGPFGALYI